MHETAIYYESITRLIIVHFDYSGDCRFTLRFFVDSPYEMERMGQEIKSWHLMDILPEETTNVR